MITFSVLESRHTTARNLGTYRRSLTQATHAFVKTARTPNCRIESQPLDAQRFAVLPRVLLARARRRMARTVHSTASMIRGHAKHKSLTKACERIRTRRF